MGTPVVMGSMCTCSFGVGASPVVATGANNLGANMPLATIMDKPTAPFGMCSSLANPAVAAATAAASGVLTPQPCTPIFPAPWAPGSPTVLVGNKPALNTNSRLMCAYAGVVSITASSATTITIP